MYCSVLLDSKFLRLPLHILCSLVTFEAAKKDVKKYYETAMSERIAEYAKTRSRAISRASETGMYYCMCIASRRTIHEYSKSHIVVPC